MIREVSVGARGSRLRGVSEITRAFSDRPRNYPEMFVDFDKVTTSTRPYLFTATLPTRFEFRVNELAEIYTEPKKCSINHYRRILNYMAENDLLEVLVDVVPAEDWKIQFCNFSVEKKSLTFAVDLPRWGAFVVQAPESGRSFVLAHGKDEELVLLDSIRELAARGFAPF